MSTIASNNYDLQQVLFSQDMNSKKKVDEAKEQLQATIADAGSGGSTGKPAPHSAMLAYMQALSGMMDGQQLVMSSTAQGAEGLETSIDEASAQLKTLNEEAGSLVKSSAKEHVGLAQELNTNMAGVQSQLSTTSMQAGELGQNINTASSQVVAGTSAGQWAVDLFTQETETRGA